MTTIGMSDLRQAAQRALKAMEDGEYRADMIEFSDAITALRAALAEPEQEPVAWVNAVMRQAQEFASAWSLVGGRFDNGNGMKDAEQARARLRAMLHAAPTPRRPLTDEEIDRVTDQQWAQNNHKPIYAAHRAYARAIERAHGIGEQT